MINENYFLRPYVCISCADSKRSVSDRWLINDKEGGIMPPLLLSPSLTQMHRRFAIEDWKLKIISFTHSDAPTSLTTSAQSMTFGWRLVGYADIIFKSFIISIFTYFFLLSRWASVEEWRLKSSADRREEIGTMERICRLTIIFFLSLIS